MNKEFNITVTDANNATAIVRKYHATTDNCTVLRGFIDKTFLDDGSDIEIRIAINSLISTDSIDNTTSSTKPNIDVVIEFVSVDNDSLCGKIRIAEENPNAMNDKHVLTNAKVACSDSPLGLFQESMFVSFEGAMAERFDCTSWRNIKSPMFRLSIMRTVLSMGLMDNEGIICAMFIVENIKVK